MWELVSITIVSTFPSEELGRRDRGERGGERDKETVAREEVVRGSADENRRLLS